MKSLKYLYRELFYEMKVCGIIFSVGGLLTLLGTFLFLGLNDADFMIAEAFCPFGYLLAIVGGIIFPLNGFHFLNKRSSADIYHSIPCSRRQLFFCTAGAVFTWIGGLMAAAFLLSAAGYLLLGISFSFYQMIVSFFVMLISGLMFASATMIAVSVSGTTLSALAAALVIAFVPRLILSAVAFGLSYNDILAMDQLGLLSPQYNISIGSWLGLLLGGVTSHSELTVNHMLEQIYSFGLPMLYSVFLTAVYLVLGCLLFVRRKSETAGNAAVNRFTQNLIRCGVAVPFIVFLMYYCCAETLQLDDTMVWIILIFAFGVYVIYELVTGRKFKKMLKSIPLFVGMTVLLLGISYGAQFIGEHIAQRTVTAEQIEDVQFDGQTAMYPMDDSYHAIKNGRLRFAQDEVKEIVSRGLSNTAQPSNNAYYQNESVTLRTVIRSSKGSFTRYVRFSMEDYKRLFAITSADERAMQAAQVLPAGKDIEKVEIGYISTVGHNELTKEQLAAVWDCAVEEYQSFTDEERTAYLFAHEGRSYSSETDIVTDVSFDTMFRIVGNGFCRGKYYSMTFEISSKFPKTQELFFSYLNNEEFVQDMVSLLRECASSDNANGYQICVSYTDAFGYHAVAATPYYYGLDTVEYSHGAATEDTESADKYVTEEIYYLKAEDDVFALLKEYSHMSYVPSIVLNADTMRQIADRLENGEYITPDSVRGYYTINLDLYSMPTNYKGYNGNSLALYISVPQQ